MKPTDNLEEAIKKDLNFAAGAELYERMLDDVLNAQEKSRKEHSAVPRPNLRRQIMKSPITKLAAAAVLIIAGLLVLFFGGGPDMANVAWGKVLQKTEQIPTVVFDMTVGVAYPEDKKLAVSSKNYVAGDYGTRSDIFVDGKLSTIKYRLPARKVAYQVRVDQKNYRRFDLSDEEAARGRDTDDPRTWLKMMLSGDYKETGRTSVNGIEVEGIACNNAGITGNENTVMRLWVDIETNLPIRIEVEGEQMEAGQVRPHKFVMENFRWNVELDESIFEPNIPDDYTQAEEPGASRGPQESSKAQLAPSQALTEQEQAAQSKAKEAVRTFLNACTGQDWDTVSKYLPYMKISQRIKDINAGLETMYIGEPSRAADGKNWLVPYAIRFKGGGTQRNTMELKEDENTGQFIVLGGF